MSFALTAEQQEIRNAVARLCERFDDEYWLKKDEAGGFPHEFHQAMAEAGWLGIAMPEAYGGSGLGITEAAILMQAVAQSGAGFSGASAIHMNIFGLHPVVVFGTDEQKQRFLPPLIAGQEKTCFAVTEPDAGLDTTRLKTRAVRRGDHYVLSGRKIWISTAQVAEKMLILARTTPIEEVARPSLGMTLFYTDLDRERRRGARDPEDGPQGSRLEPLVHRRAKGAGRGPHRRRGQGLSVHPARDEPRAHPDRRGGGRSRPRGTRPRRPLRRRAGRLRPPDRPEPGDPAPARRALDRARGGRADGAARRRRL